MPQELNKSHFKGKGGGDESRGQGWRWRNLNELKTKIDLWGNKFIPSNQLILKILLLQKKTTAMPSQGGIEGEVKKHHSAQFLERRTEI